MDFSQIALNQSLTFLTWTSSIVILVVAVFLVKLLIDLSKLSKNLNETSLILNNELKPTLEELSLTLKTINSLVASTDKGMDNLKDMAIKAFGKTKFVSKTIFGGLLKGFIAVYNMLSKNSQKRR